MMRDKINDSRIQYILAWGLIPLAYLSWCLFTLSYKSAVFAYAGGLTGVATTALYGYLAGRVMSKQRQKSQELKLVNGLLMIVAVLTAATVRSEFSVALLPAVYAIVVAIIVTTGILIKKFSNDCLKEIPTWIKRHKEIVLLSAITAILSLDTNMYQFKWDGLLYYDAVKNASMGSVSSVALYGHVAIGSGAFYRFFAMLCKDVAAGMIAANIVVLVMAVMAFYGIVKQIFPGKKELIYCACAGCFAFSPFLLGMVNYFSTDWYSVCVVVILLYFIFKRQWIMTTASACVFCLTKEPALIAYTGICVGMVLAELFEKGKLVDKFLALFGKAHYYFMLIPYFLWIGTYKIMGQWSAGSGGFSLDLKYVIEKIKVFYVLNFNWIITLLIVAGLILILVKKKLCSNLWWIMPLVISNLFLLMFNLLFKTANHPRYIDSFISVNILLAVLLLVEVVKERTAGIILGIVGVISLFACYFTFDPVSMLVLNSADTGNGRILYTAQYPLGDGSIYNKQMLSMEGLYSKVIAEALDEDNAIVIPAVDNSVYAVDGMSRTISLNEAYEKDAQFWDSERNERVPFVSEYVSAAQEMYIYHISEENILDDIDCDNELISVIYIKGINDYTASECYEFVGTTDYSYRGWVMTRDVYKKRG